MTQTPPSAQPGAGSQSNKFWDDITSTGLRRDRSRQWFAGVSAGIARRVDVDPVLIRAAFIALTLFGGLGIVAYLVLWLLMPDETGRIMARDAVDRDSGGDATGAIILSVIAVLVIAAIIFGDNGFLIGWGIIPLAIVGWLFWRHEQGRKASAWDTVGSQPPGTPAHTAPPQTVPSQGAQPSGTPSHEPQETSMYAASSPTGVPSPTLSVTSQAPGPTGAPSYPTAQQAPPWQQAPSSQQTSWQPPPAPPVPPRAHVPLAPPPPPRPRRRTAGFAGFALVLGLTVLGYGAGLMLDDPLGFPGSSELLGGVIGLGLASLATLIIGLSGRRSLMSAALVTILGLGVAGAGVAETTWDGDRGVRTWVPVATTTTQHFDHGAGRTTIDLRPLFASLGATPDAPPSPGAQPSPDAQPSPGAQPSPAPTPTPGASVAPVPPVQPTVPARPEVAPQDIDIEQGAGEMTIIVPEGVNAQIRARSAFGDVVVLGNLPEGVSDRDNGRNDGPSETVVLTLGTGAPAVNVRADMTFGQITIQEG